ncbi:MAG TPA: DUF4349 domain-containing protein [Bacillales bacterium]|nr:DUF4349 domain-containing protein [Bacillales bacterium]
MKKSIVFITLMILTFSSAACSGGGRSDSGESSSGGGAATGMNSAASDSGKFGTPKTQHSSAIQKKTNKPSTTSENPIPKRMVIYNANMTITVTHFKKTQQDIQSLINQTGGYIVQSSFSKTETGKPTGTITARIPQKKFQSFMDKVGQMAGKVENRRIHGQDVTKHYVDLKSHLKAKIAVKNRLKSFLKKAKDAGDLLDISNQLANVQGDTEQIKGEMKYLENHSALATVTISMTETDAGLKQQKDLNTWGKIQNAFIDSLNILVSIASGIVVFFIGYSPILIILAIIAVILYFIYRKRKKA